MIRLLDQETIGQIAAGEVIERPVSLVKELVENAVDAGARRVTVEVRGGGLESIAVSDDGEGIAPAELPLALRRHATSKLVAATGLAAVSTLGFRGEGLASIASVARVEIVSRAGDAELGSRVEAHGEQIGAVEPVAAPRGTRVVVRDLFGNVPVRREFLRSAAAEFTRISTWLGTLALGYPEVTFSLSHEGREAWVLPASDAIEHRLAHVFGAPAAAGMIPVEKLEQAHQIGVGGAISAPGEDRADRRMQILFVNGRLLRTTLLAGAWTAAYSTFAMTGRHPYGVLFLDLPPDHVDPNVHPTKSDVRLRYDRAVFDTVKAALGGTLRKHARERLAASIAFSPLVSETEPALRDVVAQAAAAAAGIEIRNEPLFVPELEEVTAAPRLRVLDQLDATYILASDGNALVLVDQHAAHERIAYEAIARNAREAATSEPLLVPIGFELDPAQAEILDGALDAMREGGLDIEPFGDRAYRILATPAGYRSPWTDGRRAFEVADFLADLGDEIKGLDRRQRVWASLACHSVVRAGARLTTFEMTTLVERLESCENPMHCPHGRPTIVRLDPGAIARLFKRQ